MDAARSAYRSARPATSNGCSSAVIDSAQSEAGTRRSSSQSGAFAAFAAGPVLNAVQLLHHPRHIARLDRLARLDRRREPIATRSKAVQYRQPTGKQVLPKSHTHCKLTSARTGQRKKGRFSILH